MTREDAIKTLKELWRETNDPWYEEVYNMAINALGADRKTEPTCSKMEQVDEPKTQMKTQNSNKNSNVILVSDGVSEAVRCAMCSNPNKSDRGCDGACSYDEKLYERIMKAIAESVDDTPIDKDINVRSKDEPQTCSVNGRPYDCGNCEYHKCTADEPQTERKE